MILADRDGVGMKNKETLNELRGMSLEMLKSKALELSEEAMKLRFRKKSQQLSETHQISRVRKDLARALTVIAQKEREASASK